jgi:hypothetical protein
MRAGIEITATPEDRRRLEAIARDRNAAQKQVDGSKYLAMTAAGLGSRVRASQSERSFGAA